MDFFCAGKRKTSDLTSDCHPERSRGTSPISSSSISKKRLAGGPDPRGGAPHVGVTCGAFDVALDPSLKFVLVLPSLSVPYHSSIHEIDRDQAGGPDPRGGAPHVGVTCGAFDVVLDPSLKFVLVLPSLSVSYHSSIHEIDRDQAGGPDPRGVPHTSVLRVGLLTSS
jgi:hypothetical protein